MRGLLSLLAVAAAGCGSIYYQAPQGAPTAALTVVNQSAVGDVGPGLYEKADCSDGGRALAYNTVPLNGSKTYTIEASKPASLSFSGFRTVGAKDRVTAVTANVCESFVSFVPRAGRQYEATYSDDGRVCKVVLADVSADGPRRAVELQSRRWLTQEEYQKAGGGGSPRCPVVSTT